MEKTKTAWASAVNCLYVFVGGGVGAVLRYISTAAIGGLFRGVFPLATLFVNCLGSFIIGLLFALFQAKAIPTGAAAPEGLRLFLITGFLGGFTTFSSYSLETARLFLSGSAITACLNMAASNVLCLAFTIAGLYLAGAR